MNLSRRRFLQTSMATSLPGLVALADGPSAPFSFILIGDLHFDRLEHHDYAWLEAHKSGDLSQIKNYSKLTAQVMPTMFNAVKQRIAALRDSSAPPAFVIQVGDLVEGLCGSEELAARQNREALEFIVQAELGLPFLFTKGNHDVTGNGAAEAFDQVLLPFMKEQARAVDGTSAHTQANYTIMHRDQQFAFFDAYDKTSLEWFEAVSAKRTASRLFFVVHPPVVPYGARATWHLFAGERETTKRTKLLDLLGHHEAIVLGGHLHKFAFVRRQAGGKRFTQLAVSSVVDSIDATPRDVLHGVSRYTGDQVNLEPQHSPGTSDQRRLVYESERQHVTAFEYANSAGFAVVTVDAGQVQAAVHAGTRQSSFQVVTL
jgi:Calcineurin-like phosphoesterase